MGIMGFFGGAIGWMIGGGSPLGILLGYVLGSILDGAISGSKESGSDTFNTFRQGGYTEDPAQARHDNFIFSLLVLAAYVIKADDKIMHSEMEHVRRFFRDNFGEAASRQANDILLEIFKHEIDVEGCGGEIADHMDYASRLQLLNFLVGIAKADKRVPAVEMEALRRITRALRLDTNELDSLLNLGGGTLEAAYQVLGVDENVSDEELKRAYKKLVLKHHPDRVATLGEDIRRNAEEKLKQINQAYETVTNARGM